MTTRRKIKPDGEIDYNDQFFDQETLPERPSEKIDGIAADKIRQEILKVPSESSVTCEYRVRGALIVGNLHLEHIKFGGYLRFENCYFKNGLDLRHIKLHRLKLVNCRFDEILEADVAEIFGDVEIRNCTFSHGLVFRAAKVGGRFVIEGTTVNLIVGRPTRGPYALDTAFDASMLHVEHGLQLKELSKDSIKGTDENKVLIRTKLTGALDLSAAHIGSNLEIKNSDICVCENSDIRKKLALDLTNANVSGFFFVREKSHFNGKINLFGARLRLFSTDNSTIQSSDKYAIDGEEVTVATSFAIGDAAIISGINLLSAKIGGVFQFGGSADESSGMDRKKEGSKSEDAKVSGSLNLMHARIGRLAIDFQLWERHCKLEKAFSPYFNGCIYGDIQSVQDHDTKKLPLQKWVKSLYSEVDQSERKGTSTAGETPLYIRNTPQIYHQLMTVLCSKGHEEQANSIERISILSIIKENSPDILKPLIEKFEYLIFKFNSPKSIFEAQQEESMVWFIFVYPFFFFKEMIIHFVKPFLIILKSTFYFIKLIFYWMIGYQRNPIRLTLIAAVYVLIMGYVYLIGYNNGEIIPLNPLIFNSINQNKNQKPEEICEIYKDIECLFTFKNYQNSNSVSFREDTLTELNKDTLQYPRREYSSFHPLWYSLDVFLPLVSFSQEISWAPSTSNDTISLLWVMQIIQVMLGWAFSGLLIGLVSGLIRQKK